MAAAHCPQQAPNPAAAAAAAAAAASACSLTHCCLRPLVLLLPHLWPTGSPSSQGSSTARSVQPTGLSAQERLPQSTGGLHHKAADPSNEAKGNGTGATASSGAAGGRKGGTTHEGLRASGPQRLPVVIFLHATGEQLLCLHMTGGRSGVFLHVTGAQ